MSSHVQLQVLQKEGKVLQKLHAKLSDQLSRLKVEELALLSEIRASQVEKVEDSNSVSFQPPKEEMPELNEMSLDADMEADHEVNTINEQPLVDLEPPMQEDMMKLDGNIIEEEEDEDDDMFDDEEDLPSVQDELARFVQGLERQTQM